ncbi:hypothetical protein [Psychrobacter sp.]|uniref:hypothetical protein n=1 Tax=Psychrobacter sp. TaxID=56811 RepID=UPI003BB0755F
MGAVIIGLVAFLLLPALLVYSLVRPTKLHIRTKKNPNGKWSRGKFSLGVLAAWIAAIAIGVAITPEQSTTIDVAEVAADAGLTTDNYEVHDNGAIEIKAPDESIKTEGNILWYQDDLSEPVENVGMLNGEDILNSAGLDPDETEESADHMGEPKKLYIINDDTPISAWFSHSPNSISLNWYQYSDEPETLEISQQSLKDAYKLARAMAGMEGYDAVMYLSNGGIYRSKPVGGYPTTGQCNEGACFIHIDLKS